MEDAFLFSESKRYDVKGKSYFDSPNKYYCEDIGLRNVRIGFRQQEMTNKLTLAEQEELFAKDCKLINLKYEYSGYTGDERCAIITELSVKELWVYKPEGKENIRCLCPKCLNNYIHNPDYIVR